MTSSTSSTAAAPDDDLAAACAAATYEELQAAQIEVALQPYDDNVERLRVMNAIGAALRRHEMERMPRDLREIADDPDCRDDERAYASRALHDLETGAVDPRVLLPHAAAFRHTVRTRRQRVERQRLERSNGGTRPPAAQAPRTTRARARGAGRPAGRQRHRPRPSGQSGDSGDGGSGSSEPPGEPGRRCEVCDELLPELYANGRKVPSNTRFCPGGACKQAAYDAKKRLEKPLVERVYSNRGQLREGEKSPEVAAYEARERFAGCQCKYPAVDQAGDCAYCGKARHLLGRDISPYLLRLWALDKSGSGPLAARTFSYSAEKPQRRKPRAARKRVEPIETATEDSLDPEHNESPLADVLEFPISWLCDERGRLHFAEMTVAA